MSTLAETARSAGQALTLAAPGVRAARQVCRSGASDLVRVAALVEVAAAAASLARTIVRLRHLDPAAVAGCVGDVTDLRAVLGRGRWLPTMTRHVPIPGRAVTLTARRETGPTPAGQDALFALAGVMPAGGDL